MNAHQEHRNQNKKRNKVYSKIKEIILSKRNCFMEPCSNSSTWTNYEPDLVLYMKHTTSNSNKRTILHKAAIKGYTNYFKPVHLKIQDINAQDDVGWTALHYAASYGHIEIVKILISNDANVSIKTNNGELAAHVICTNTFDKRSRHAIGGIISLAELNQTKCDKLSPESKCLNNLLTAKIENRQKPRNKLKDPAFRQALHSL